MNDWEREHRKNQKLSVAELVRRGTKIETNINQGLAVIESQRSDQERSDSAIAIEDQSLEITECFALAALTYLYVVSGAYPDPLELKDSVSRGMDVLNTLPGQKLLDRVVWPVCVIGCITSESKQEPFRSIVTGGDVAMC